MAEITKDMVGINAAGGNVVEKRKQYDSETGTGCLERNNLIQSLIYAKVYVFL